MATGSYLTQNHSRSQSAAETSGNITARVIERDTSGEIYYLLKDSRGFSPNSPTWSPMTPKLSPKSPTS
ncbi:hypothetical protein TNCV_2196881 [Trichonephila clavipes]|nr:hypothetical protein TNCV_2196881 [Trichonephila clavipes]